MEVALTREEAWQMETMEISNRMTGLKGKRSLPVNIQPWLFFLMQSYMVYTCRGAIGLSTEASAGCIWAKCFHLCGDAARWGGWCPSRVVLGVFIAAALHRMGWQFVS